MPAGSKSSNTAAANSTLSNEVRLSKKDRQIVENAAAAIAIAGSTPVQQVILWTRDKQYIPTTHWIKGNQYGTQIVQSKQGLFWPVAGGVWKLEYQEIPVPLCDLQKNEQSNLQLPMSQLEESGTMTIPKMVDLISGMEYRLVSAPAVTDKDAPLFSQYSFDSKVTATLGPYVIVQHTQNAVNCNSQNNFVITGFSVFNLETGQIENIFTPEEKQSILKNEQTYALNQLNSQSNLDTGNLDDIVLTAILPMFVSGFGMTLNYQFTYQFAENNQTDDQNIYASGSYSRSIVTQAQTIPEALAPFVTLQPALQNLVVFGDSFIVGGFFPIGQNEKQYRVLLQTILSKPLKNND